MLEKGKSEQKTTGFIYEIPHKASMQHALPYTGSRLGFSADNLTPKQSKAKVPQEKECT